MGTGVSKPSCAAPNAEPCTVARSACCAADWAVRRVRRGASAVEAWVLARLVDGLGPPSERLVDKGASSLGGNSSLPLFSNFELAGRVMLVKELFG